MFINFPRKLWDIVKRLVNVSMVIYKYYNGSLSANLTVICFYTTIMIVKINTDMTMKLEKSLLKISYLLSEKYMFNS